MYTTKTIFQLGVQIIYKIMCPLEGDRKSVANAFKFIVERICINFKPVIRMVLLLET